MTLTVPGEWDDKDERAVTYSALRGLLEAKAAKSWSIPGAGHKYACLQLCLERWAESISVQFLSLRDGPEGWSPAQAALELRLLCVLATTPLDRVPSKKELLSLGVGEIGPVREFQTDDFQKAINSLLSKEGRLLEMIQARSSTKGAAVGKYLDAAAFVDALAEFKRRGYLPMPLPPEDAISWQGNKEVFLIAKDVHRKWADSMRAEFEARKSWLDRVTEAFGVNVGLEGIHSGLQPTISAIAAMGNFSGTNDTLTALASFKNTNYEEVVRATKKLRSEKNLKPWEMACDVKEAISSSDKLVLDASNLLRAVETMLRSRLESRGASPDESNSIASRIRSNLESIVRRLTGESK